jgi:hypothetical protein
MQWIADFWSENPELHMLVIVLCSYAVTYLMALMLTYLVIRLRPAEKPPADRVAHIVLCICFGLVSILPIYNMYQLGSGDQFHPVWWHYLPYALFAAFNLLIVFALLTIREPKKRKA